MNRRVLGKTGLEVSPLTIGAWQLGGPLAFDGQPDGHPDPGRAAVLRLIRTLGDAGINAIDTAEQYGNGESERRVGEAIRGHREEWIVSTKFGYRVGPDGRRNDSSHPSTIVPSIEGSLKRLRTDYIDIYLYHCAPRPEELDEGRAVLARLVREGKCRYVGISTNNRELIEAMAERDMLEVLQYRSNLLNDSSDILAVAAARHVGTQVRGVMAQGRLSGRYFGRQPVWAADDNRSRLGAADDFTRYAGLQKALPEGVTMAQAAIRWILDQPGNHTICMGAKRMEDYQAAIQAAGMPPLSAECRAELAARGAALQREQTR